MAFSNPPEFFKDRSKQLKWIMPPSTVSLWPYEKMYCEEAKTNGKYNPVKRRILANEYFEKFEANRSIIFYYSNYSNPFNEEDQRRYVIVGISKLKKIGEELFYQDCSPTTIKKYGGFVWQRNICSHYPDQGFRLPYHLYFDQPDIMNKILFVPDNPRNFKYATREISDDDALSLV